MQKMFFVPDAYEEMACMEFKNMEECVAFSNYLDSIGKRWISGDRYTDRNTFNVYSDTVYYFNKGMYGSKDVAIINGRTVLAYGDFYFDSDELLETEIELTFNKLFGYEQTDI